MWDGKKPFDRVSATAGIYAHQRMSICQSYLQTSASSEVFRCNMGNPGGSRWR